MAASLDWRGEGERNLGNEVQNKIKKGNGGETLRLEKRV